LIVSNGLFNAGTISVLLGNGNGTFAVRQTFAAASQPTNVALCDINGDGKLDLLVANELSDNVGMLLGSGDGTFQPQQTLASGPRPFAISAADLNGDGRPDVIATNHLSATLGTMVSSNGSFTGQLYYIGPPSPGSPDLSYGNLGHAMSRFQGSVGDAGEAMAVQSDGKVLVGGISAQRFAFARYNSDGTLDATFGTGGAEAIPIGQSDFGLALGIQTDGKIVMAGSASIGNSSPMVVLRLNRDGSLDTTFNGTGWRAISFGGANASALALAIQGDGKLVLAGDTNTAAASGTLISALARLNTDGSLDTTFGGTGTVTNSSGASNSELMGLAIDSSNRIVASGGWGSGIGVLHFGVARYNGDGSPDTTFGSGGVDASPIGTNTGRATAVALAAGGKIVAAGWENTGTSTGGDIVVAQFTSTGALDTNFGINGAALFDTNHQADTGTSVAVSSGGLITVGGYTYNGSVYSTVVLRLTASGALDSTYNNTGRAVSTTGLFTGLSLRSDGSVYAAGLINQPFITGHSGDFLAARFTYTDVLETAFASSRF
jgi:uncharacterized delta-60 repeat protein